MAESLSKIQLSGANANGGWLTITQQVSLGETIHAAHATALDEIWLWATNESTSSLVLTLQWGAAIDPQITTIEPQAEPQLLIPGWLMTGSDELTAFCPTTALVMIHGYVNRITTA